MKAVRLTRANTLAPWTTGDVNAILLLDDEEAEFVVNELKLGVYDPRYDPQPPSWTAGGVQEVPAKSAAVSVPPAPVEDDGTEDPLYDDDPLVPLKIPWTNAPKADWVTWAIHGDHGLPPAHPDEAAGMTKNQLMSRYGERL